MLPTKKILQVMGFKVDLMQSHFVGRVAFTEDFFPNLSELCGNKHPTTPGK